MYMIINTENFRQLPKDPTTTLQTKCNNYITRLFKSNSISKEQEKTMKCYNSVCPKIYGNPKIHKQGYPLRPIVASIQSPMSSLAEFTAKVLSNAYDQNNDYYIKNSFEFASFMNNQIIPPGYQLASLDVVNLFGNIYKELVLEVIEVKWSIIEEHCNVPKALFLEIIEFLLTNNYFTFQGEYYVQIFGCSMGSKVSPILSLYVMDYVLTMVIPRLSFRVLILKKFVDDLIVVIPDTGFDEILDVLNSFNTHIQFTIEREEVNNSVPFLDTRVCRMNETIKLDWYRKKIHSNRFIHFKSEHPIGMKINCIKEMKNRIEKICHPDLVDANIKKLHKIFQDNSYPKQMLNKLLYETNTIAIEQPQPRPEQIENMDENSPTMKYGSLPNLGNLTNKIKNCFKDEKVKIATYNTKTVKRLFSKLKDSTPTPLKSNVVYKINCSECDGTYVGQTSQWLKSRLSLHRSDIQTMNPRCALASHSIQKNHKIDFDSAEILCTQGKYSKRLIMEMINIRNQTNPINKKTDIQKLSNVYTYLLTYPNREKEEFYDGPLDE